MAEFLLEIFSEEIPARMQARAAEDLKAIVTGRLGEAGLSFAKAEAYVTPRRLALVVDGLPVARPDVTEERKGPRADAPEKAIEGFLRSAGLTREQCEVRDTPKGPILFAVTTVKGGPTVEALGPIIRHVLMTLPWPKSMRAAEEVVRWVRPLHHVLALFDGAVVDFSYDLHTPDIAPDGPRARKAVGTTRGHRFMAPDAFPVRGFADYKAKLAQAFVILDREERKRLIASQIAEAAKAQALMPIDAPGLLEEVAGLVEWPVALVGRIDESFMDVPAEVLTTSMRTHQKYFALARADGGLAPRFVTVANIEATDGGETIVKGNERVLRARLSDAKFFWDQDRAVPLDSRLPALAQVTFHARLGTVEQKVGRMAALAERLSSATGGAPGLARRAAVLAKADLTSGMVGEFPELQGLMGRYYALQQGESPEVADAVADHYKPLGPSDACPSQPVSIAAALADKIDTLVGFFAIDEKPTGSRDPYALRRAALGVIRLLVENSIALPLRQTFTAAHTAYGVEGLRDAATVASELLAFVADRLKVAMRERGVRHDLIDAVFAVGGEDDLLRLLGRVDALAAFLGSEDGGNLLTAYRRAANIVRIEAKKDGVEGFGAVDPASLATAEEKALHHRLHRPGAPLQDAIEDGDFTGAMAQLAAWRGPVDAFFDAVLVNDPEPAVRRNRLALLEELTSSMNKVADFARIEG